MLAVRTLVRIATAYPWQQSHLEGTGSLECDSCARSIQTRLDQLRVLLQDLDDVIDRRSNLRVESPTALDELLPVKITEPFYHQKCVEKLLDFVFGQMSDILHYADAITKR